MSQGIVAALHRTRSQGAFERPSTLQPLQYSGVPYAKHFGPFAKVLSLSVQCQRVVTSLVVHLNEARRPLHIARFIAHVVIDPVKRVLRRWPRSDVFNEGRERCSPTLAHANTTAAVVVEILVSRIRATLVHVRPQSIFSRVAQSMRGVSLLEHFSEDAAATRRLSSRKIATADRLCFTAGATARPITRVGCGSVEHCKSTVYLAFHVDPMRHLFIIPRVSP